MQVALPRPVAAVGAGRHPVPPLRMAYNIAQNRAASREAATQTCIPSRSQQVTVSGHRSHHARHQLLGAYQQQAAPWSVLVRSVCCHWLPAAEQEQHRHWDEGWGWPSPVPRSLCPFCLVDCPPCCLEASRQRERALAIWQVVQIEWLLPHKLLRKESVLSTSAVWPPQHYVV
jgi:hypothetical protein